MKKVAKISLKLAHRSFDKIYSYLVPASLKDEIKVGQLVKVPFGRGNSSREAYVIALDWQEETGKLKEIKSIELDQLVNEDQIKLAAQIKHYYNSSLGAAISLMAPASVAKVGAKTIRFCELVDPDLAQKMLKEGSFNSLNHVRVVECLLQEKEMPTKEIEANCQVSPAVLRTMAKNKIIYFFPKVYQREEAEISFFAEQKVEKLSLSQELALAQILEPAESKLNEFLLFGVTGSGKTEVYLRAAKEVIKRGKTAIILVPEISLTPLMISRIASFFPDRLAVIHSRLTLQERYEQWQKILRKEVDIVVGVRSAIFSPLENIGLIVIDEEQESTYKSETSIPYQAAEIARFRAIMHQATLVLGSATPAVETFARTVQKKSKLISLPERINEQGLPEVKLIDMQRRDPSLIVAGEIKAALRDCFLRGEQAIIFVNKRGKSRYVMCSDCGEVCTCDNCAISLWEHYNPHGHTSNLVCHYCSALKPMPRSCQACGGSSFISPGYGTQTVEKWFEQEFPEQKALRMDFDTTAGRDSHKEILLKFSRQEASCLIGTQMIAKGHDFPNVSLVCILSADSILAQDHYRASERAFSLITQAAGRAGRHDLEGKVFVQAYQVSHFAIKAALRQNYLDFYNEEIETRRILEQPPYYFIGYLLAESKLEEEAKLAIDRVHRWCLEISKRESDLESLIIFQPGPSPIKRLRGKYRFRLIIKAKQRKELSSLFHILKQQEVYKSFPGLSLKYDINPEQSM